MKQHKWHKEIKAWADGAEIEMRCQEPSIKKKIWSKWEQFDNEWTEEDWWEFRIKSQPKEPQYLYVYFGNHYIIGHHHFVSTAHPKGMKEYEYLGKIPLIVESNDD